MRIGHRLCCRRLLLTSLIVAKRAADRDRRSNGRRPPAALIQKRAAWRVGVGEVARGGERRREAAAHKNMQQSTVRQSILQPRCGFIGQQALATVCMRVQNDVGRRASERRNARRCSNMQTGGGGGSDAEWSPQRDDERASGRHIEPNFRQNFCRLKASAMSTMRRSLTRLFSVLSFWRSHFNQKKLFSFVRRGAAPFC